MKPLHINETIDIGQVMAGPALVDPAATGGVQKEMLLLTAQDSSGNVVYGAINWFALEDGEEITQEHITTVFSGNLFNMREDIEFVPDTEDASTGVEIHTLEATNEVQDS